ncbi:MAG: DUF4956 domain-containing protein [Atopobiaceae bacterium]|nr:DUF4956 domain-containing protein [Atopobiaceae bacterium]
MFDSLFATTDTVTSTLSLVPFITSVAFALALGLVLALVYCYRSRHNKGFVMTLAMLPAIVCVVISMVNGNVGTGVAVAGAFSLVRFRSVPGSARDIGFIFLAMVVGLVCGMGYVGYAVLTTVILCGGFFVYQLVGFGSESGATDRTLRITVPEDLDYTRLFDDVLTRYTTYHELTSVKTTNMGSLYRLTYDIGMVDSAAERAFIDELRCRNGNLEIAISRQETGAEQL